METRRAISPVPHGLGLPQEGPQNTMRQMKLTTLGACSSTQEKQRIFLETSQSLKDNNPFLCLHICTNFIEILSDLLCMCLDPPVGALIPKTLSHSFIFTNFSYSPSLKQQQFHQALLTEGFKASGLPCHLHNTIVPTENIIQSSYCA